MTDSIYLDNNATTHLSSFVSRRMHELIDADPGNPESPHSGGESARKLVSDTRLRIADTLNSSEECIIFTGSGSESNSYAIERVASRLSERGRVLTSWLEHSSVIRGMDALEARGVRVEYARVCPTGVIDLEDLIRRTREGCEAIFVQWANNETGAIQPVEEISRIAREAGAFLHVDAAQAYGRARIDLERVKVDSLTLTAHKIHGPKGVAALYSRAPRELVRVIYGGQQEFGIRGGTHNVLGIGGFEAAVEDRFSDFQGLIRHMSELRDRLESGILDGVAGCVVRARDVERVVNTCSVTFPGADGSQLIAWLDSNGVQCSQTSACRSSRPEPSPVLLAMGLSEEDAYSTIRFSVSPLNTLEEIDRAVSLICHAYRDVKSYVAG